ncbi:hypothetical protein O0L34_g9266 [Tuta absoluta]|nr:hypothetical protein O0L34_g9266 [Tuta absoluta]
MGRGVPLAMLVYYILGAGLFGIARSKQPLEAAMFPLEFTTTGGLEHVECYVRIVYGIYVEGAMVLLSCALATLRRHSSHSARNMADQYRLFAQERQHDEEE